jgi:hypothetical protein
MCSISDISISQSNGAIKGTWVVDTNIEVPLALRQSPGLFNGFKEQGKYQAMYYGLD